VAGATRTEIVVTFLAVLELIRLKQIGVAQESPFSPIELVKIVVETREDAEEETEETNS
jgi:chromatin segregation and condensation protein Rec8/ScpA/Scc1 (kleisin family)